MQKVPRSTKALIALSVGVILACFILATPRNGGPDEYAHAAQSAALWRGQRVGVPHPAAVGVNVIEVPAIVVEPNPHCWTHRPEVPVNCAVFEPTEGVVYTEASAARYPPWAYVVPGLASFMPWTSAYLYVARFLMALIPLLLVSSSLARVARLGPGAFSAAMLGLTPIAWFSMSIVNPSALAISAGFALWVALLIERRSASDWLLAASWAGLVLPRRDGPLWALLIVAAVCVATSTQPSAVWARQSPPIRVVIAVSSAVAVVTAFVVGNGLSLVLAVAPLGLIALEFVMMRMAAAGSTSARRRWLGGSVLASVAFVALGISLSPGKFSPQLWPNVIRASGRHLRQLIGNLGWLDTPVPESTLYLFWVAIGMTLAFALVERRRIAVVAIACLAITVVTAWVFEIGRGTTSEIYWQGRYSMPFVIGLPLLLAYRSSTGVSPNDSMLNSVSNVIGGCAWWVINAGFVGALHRWGVGLEGTWSPRQWDTWGTVVPPPAFMTVVAVASAILIFVVPRRLERSGHSVTA